MDENTGIDEFMGAFDAEEGNQTEPAQEPVETDEAGDVGEETADVETAAQEGDAADQPKEETPGATDGETFTLKVNKEEKTYSREEVISLAQKGADYDRVKEQLAQSRETATNLQKEIDEQRGVMEALTDIAKETGTEIDQLIADLRHNLWKKQGLSDDAITERELRIKAEKENAKLRKPEKEPAKPDAKDRAKKDLEEFRKEYPNVELTDDLLQEMSKDIQGGSSLIVAYRKREAAQKDAKIEELEKALAAERKNKENRATSPGSQKDSGGKRNKSEFDDFMEAFK